MFSNKFRCHVFSSNAKTNRNRKTKNINNVFRLRTVEEETKNEKNNKKPNVLDPWDLRNNKSMQMVCPRACILRFFRAHTARLKVSCGILLTVIMSSVRWRMSLQGGKIRMRAWS
jgi:hypothetical protein